MKAWEIYTGPFDQNLNQFAFQKQIINYTSRRAAELAYNAVLSTRETVCLARQPPSFSPCLRRSVMPLSLAGRSAFIISR